MPHPHGPILFPFVPDWGGAAFDQWSGVMTVNVRNISGRTFTKGEVASVDFTGTTGSEITVSMPTTSSDLGRSRVLGPVISEKIEANALGTVVWAGDVQKLMVTGTVAKGDLLALQTVAPRNVAVAVTGFGHSYFAIAHEAHSGARSTIRALILDWRT